MVLISVEIVCKGRMKWEPGITKKLFTYIFWIVRDYSVSSSNLIHFKIKKCGCQRLQVSIFLDVINEFFKHEAL